MLFRSSPSSVADGALSANLRGLLSVPGREGSGSSPPFVQRVRGSASFGFGNRSGRRSVGKRNESRKRCNTTHRWSVLVGYVAVPHYHSPCRSQYLAVVSNSLPLSLCCHPQSFAIVSDTFPLSSPIFCRHLRYFSVVAPCALHATRLLIIFIFFIWYMIFYSCIRHLTDTCF